MAIPAESEPLLPRASTPRNGAARLWVLRLGVAVATIGSLLVLLNLSLHDHSSGGGGSGSDDGSGPDKGDDPLSAASLEACAWPLLEPHVSLLDVPAIARDEYLSRQETLASALAAAGVDAFIAEPSASTEYYANISSSFDLSERPFLMLLEAKTGVFSYLVPQFETGRIAGLDMVYDNRGRTHDGKNETESVAVAWAEEESPYAVLARARPGWHRVMLDDHTRYMIAAGLQGAGIEVVPMSETVQSLRAVKTAAEVALLRGINTFTLELVRSVQKCLRVGVAQEAVVTAASQLFARAGVGEGFWSIVLFGDQAAYPHGGKHGKTLAAGEFALIDIGSALHGYGSDVTRTILPTGAEVSDELMGIWQTVYAAQSAGFERMRANETCSEVDAASRVVVEEAGYGPFYTHRLGHGLGLEMHEHPYLNGANSEKLKPGEVVTNEPGIYVTTEQARTIGREIGFGVRLEDPILVTDNGGEPMTGRRARSPYEP
ncbi:X-Pro dipeptidase [Apiospora rasikravindrae]|uniref:X-Pro dipeptidase n=1 Tax=Apiospora rasikravindrae TaxID=990691 RepID=A0ABR1SIU3_9PEZI